MQRFPRLSFLTKFFRVRQSTVAVIPDIPNGSIAGPVGIPSIDNRQLGKLDTKFENARDAFKSKTNLELLRGLIVFRICTNDRLVKNNQRILHWLRRLVKPVVERLRKYGVKVILGYSVESDVAGTIEGRSDTVGTRAYDHNRDLFCESIDAVSSIGTDGLMAIKVTALGPADVLLRQSEAILQMQNLFRIVSPSIAPVNGDQIQEKLKANGIELADETWLNTVNFNRNGTIDYFDWQGQLDNTVFRNLFNGNGVDAPAGDTIELANIKQRIINIVEHAQTKGVRVLIDAEQSYLQLAIARFAMEIMQRYNINATHVFNTYQCYRRNAFDNIQLDMQLAADRNFHFGAKLVRGAYMVQERARAVEFGYEDPINPTYADTTQMYERVLTRVLQERQARQPDQVSVMIASHNEQTVHFAVQLMENLAIPPSDKNIHFGQLYGMCDQVSFSLGQAGYSVYKNVPYGPVGDVLPYLSRRALENGQMLKKVAKERRLLWTELKRRLLAGQLRTNHF